MEGYTGGFHYIIVKHWFHEGTNNIYQKSYYHARTLLSGNDVNALDTWIEKAEALQIEELNSFLKLNQSDKEAVKNAIRYQYSNGPTEGCNNKIKVIKR